MVQLFCQRAGYLRKYQFMPRKPLDISEEEIANAVCVFNRKAKFSVDESVDAEVGKYLKEKGWNTKPLLRSVYRDTPMKT